MILILSNFLYLDVKGLASLFFFLIFILGQTNKYFPAHKGEREETAQPQDNMVLFLLLSGWGAGICNLKSELADA